MSKDPVVKALKNSKKDAQKQGQRGHQQILAR